MIKNLTKFCIVLSCIFGFAKTCATEIYPFSLYRQNGTILEGYFSPPATSSSPIICAIQDSSCESALKWHGELSEQAGLLGVGLIVLEKQGVSKNAIDPFEYDQTNSLQNRLEDYVLCLENMSTICPGWIGQVIFWGESEGGLLAANLAAQTPETAAVLLFATGGGMKPREEVKWAIRLRLKEHGASQDEIDQYMSFLENQMEEMILNPTPLNYFLGNTYKWWASFLTADEPLMFLNQLSIPIYLAHGVEDTQIPILSADLAAEALTKTHALTYLRLEGFGHDLSQADIQSAAWQWLGSVLFEQELPDSYSITTMTQFPTPLAVDWRTDMAQYIFKRGNGEGKGKLSVSAEGKRDTEGNESASGRISVSKETDSGLKIQGGVKATESKDHEGHLKGDVSVELRGDYEF